MWEAYIQLGIRHILDIRAYDHLLFIVALCAIYRVCEWKHLLIPVTAFTIGHSISLALSSNDILKLNPQIIEFLIPLTILLTCIFNIIHEKHAKPKAIYIYVLTLTFGVIHGFGFANFFIAILGSQNQIMVPLLSFNIGVEIGQLFIIGGFLVLTYLVTKILGIKHKVWNYFLSVTVGIISIYLMINQLV